MELGPREYEAELAAAEVAVDHLKVVDPDLGFAFSVARMEVREAVIVEEHRDRNPEEAADRGHELIMARVAAAPHLSISFRVSFPNPFLGQRRGSDSAC